MQWTPVLSDLKGCIAQIEGASYPFFEDFTQP
jgi:hypothetical protein